MRLMKGNTTRLVYVMIYILQHFVFNEIQILSWTTYIKGKDKGQIITHCAFGAVDKINTVALL